MILILVTELIRFWGKLNSFLGLGDGSASKETLLNNVSLIPWTHMVAGEKLLQQAVL